MTKYLRHKRNVFKDVMLFTWGKQFQQTFRIIFFSEWQVSYLSPHLTWNKSVVCRHFWQLCPTVFNKHLFIHTLHWAFVQGLWPFHLSSRVLRQLSSGKYTWYSCPLLSLQEPYKVGQAERWWLSLSKTQTAILYPFIWEQVLRNSVELTSR